MGEELDRQPGESLREEVPDDEAERKDDEHDGRVARRHDEPVPEYPPHAQEPAARGTNGSRRCAHRGARRHATASRFPPVAQWTRTRAIAFTTMVTAKRTRAISISAER